MSIQIYAGETSQSIDLFLQDSSSIQGSGLAGLAYNTAGLTAYYRKGISGSSTAISLISQVATGDYISGGFAEVDSVNMPGIYRLDLPNNIVDVEGLSTIYLRGASNLLPTSLRIDCRPLAVDIRKISQDSDAADNLESMYDGTGYTDNTAPASRVQLESRTLPSGEYGTGSGGSGTTPAAVWSYAQRTLTSVEGISGDIQTISDTALSLYDGPTRSELTSDKEEILGSGQLEFNQLSSDFGLIKGAGFNTSTDSLESIRNRGDSAWITATGFSTLSASDIYTQTSGALQDYDSPTYSEFESRTLPSGEYGTGLGDATLANQIVIVNYLESGVSLDSSTQTQLDGLSTFNPEIHRVAISGNIDTLDDLNNVSTSDIYVQASSALQDYNGPTYSEFEARTLPSGDYGSGGGGGSATLGNQTVIIDHLTDIKGDGFVESTDSLESIRDRGDAAWLTGAGSGSGARTVNIVVDDGTDRLQNATVRLTEGLNTFTANTDVGGTGVFNIDDATYSLAITKSGYSFGGSTLEVSADATESYSMSAINISPPSNPDASTGYATLYDHTGQIEPSAKASVQLIDGPGTAGLAYDNKIWTETADSSGLVQFQGMFRGARYRYWRGPIKTNALVITVPNSGTFPLDEMIGARR